MGEIRSTMDIIMERTKGLTLSDEEKRQFREQEMTGKIRGLVQRCLDGVLTMDRFRVEMAALRKKDRETADRLLRDEMLAILEPGKGNETALDILKEVEDIDIGGITERLGIFSRQIEEARSTREKMIMERLEKRGVSGSAVIPNPEADPEWRDLLEEKLKSFRKELTSL